MAGHGLLFRECALKLGILPSLLVRNVSVETSLKGSHFLPESLKFPRPSRLLGWAVLGLRDAGLRTDLSLHCWARTRVRPGSGLGCSLQGGPPPRGGRGTDRAPDGIKKTF